MAAIIPFPAQITLVQSIKEADIIINTIESGVDLGSREYHIRYICANIDRLLVDLKAKMETLNADVLISEGDRKDLTEAVEFFFSKAQKARDEMAIFLG